MSRRGRPSRLAEPVVTATCHIAGCGRPAAPGWRCCAGCWREMMATGRPPAEKSDAPTAPSDFRQLKLDESSWR
jgi:hypothetical protein